jgi:hypothetical protein
VQIITDHHEKNTRRNVFTVGKVVRSARPTADSDNISSSEKFTVHLAVEAVPLPIL